MRQFLRLAGNPHLAAPTTIVAGTNGKGSTSATLASILRRSGYRTALYTSPHLVSLLERWRINDADLDEETFVEAVRRVRFIMQKHDVALTYFEALTAVGFVTFAMKECDVTVLEVGMGGRLDATNVTRPLASLVTPIGLDHIEYLGPTLRRIAREKAGVIHRGTVALTSNRDRAVLEVLKRRCDSVGVPLRVSWRTTRDEKVRSTLDGLSFRLDTRHDEYRVRSPLPGEHQVDNISLAVIAAEALQSSFPKITRRSIERGISETRWRGRLEHFAVNDKDVIVDGAHNAHAAVPLADFIREHLPGERLLVFGVMADKDVSDIAALLVPLFDRIVVTEPDPVRAAKTADLAATLQRFGVPIVERAKPRDALRYALRQRERSVIVAGSLYLAGEAVALLDSLTV